MEAMFNRLTLFFLIFTSCSPYKIILNNSVLPSIYFEQKIKRLEKKETSFKKNRDLIKTKIEYSYGVILEHNDRIIEDDYLSTIENNKKAHSIFKEVQQLCLKNLNSSFNYKSKEKIRVFKSVVNISIVILPLVYTQYVRLE